MVHRQEKEFKDYERKLNADWNAMDKEIKQMDKFGSGAEKEGEAVLKAMDKKLKEIEKEKVD